MGFCKRQTQSLPELGFPANRNQEQRVFKSRWQAPKPRLMFWRWGTWPRPLASILC